MNGVLSTEDEEAVEAELNELISIEHQKAVDLLPTVPSDDLPVSDPGNYFHFVIKYYVLQHIFIFSASRGRKVTSKEDCSRSSITFLDKNI